MTENEYVNHFAWFLLLRQLSNEYVTSGSFSLVRGLVVLLPISILNVIVFYWIFSSLHQNIEVSPQAVPVLLPVVLTVLEYSWLRALRKH